MGSIFWKIKELKFKSSSNKIKFNVLLVPFWYEGIGLMFKSRNKAKPLLFSYKFLNRMAIFSYFITFDFIAIWINKEGRVVDIKNIKPKTKSIKPKEKFVKLIEIPNLKKYSKEIEFFSKYKNKEIILISPSLK